MKTWFNLIPLLILAFVTPMLVGLIPTIEWKDRFIGGGPIREESINLMVSIIPTEKGNILIDRFMESDIAGEYLLYLPIAINISLICVLIVYCLGSILITLNNAITNATFHEKRNAVKN